jgi:hypothetical protein
MRKAFTFVEVICILLVIAIGLMGVLGLVSYGMHVSAAAQGRLTGMMTAISVAADPTPLLDPQLPAGSWSYTPYDMNTTQSTLTSTAKGFINGYYVERTETSVDRSGANPALTDIIAMDKAQTPPEVYVRSALVTVNVYDTLGGELLTTYSTRVLRQRGMP